MVIEENDNILNELKEGWLFVAKTESQQVVQEHSLA
jgi:hypothetical protein